MLHYDFSSKVHSRRFERGEHNFLGSVWTMEVTTNVKY